MLSSLDFVILAVYLAVVAAVGLAAGRRQRGPSDYYLARRALPWWAAGLSILATETSALTFVGVPTQSLRGDWTYLQLALGSVAGRLAVATLLVGAYYRAEVVTVYGYLGRRFGAATRNLSTGLFFVGRLLGSGVRLYGGAIALVIVADVDFPLAIAAIAAVAAFYTLLGGLRSVVWTDLLQGVLLVAGAVAALVSLTQGVEGGLEGALTTLSEATTAAGHSKLRLVDLSLDPRRAYTLVAGLVGAAFLTLSTHGADQDLIQRSLACRGSREGRRSLALSAALVIPVAALFLAVGSLLWVRLGGDAGAAALAGELAAAKGLASSDKAYDLLFPLYVVRELPAGVRGLVLAGLFASAMSSLDSAISALSTTAVRCVWRPLVGPGPGPRRELAVARTFALGFALLLVTVALVVWRTEGAGGERQGFGVLMLGLKVLTWVFPPLLGVLLVGTLTRRGSDRGAVTAVLTGVATVLAAEFWHPLFGSPAPFAWIWNPVAGALVAFAVGAAFREGG
ncbi:MAG: hypothetical protein R3325_03655 [Thermoanaerobaculia bacterium]|nr:hypothetical protein [Thermoanaerobaculia bacterium]